MKKYLVVGLIALIFSAGSVLAKKPDLTPGGRVKVTIPAHAVKIAPGVFSLGTARDKGRVVEGYAFVYYKKGFGKGGKPSKCNNDGFCGPGENSKNCPGDCGGEPDPGSSCYGFLARGAKWKTVEDYIVDPTNTRGLDETFVRDNLATDIAKWEAAAGVNILGDETAGTVDGADLDNPDEKNEVYFGSIDEPGAIAITIVWGIFGGPPHGRKLVEWDQVYDEVDFDWSATEEAGKMDFESIATHELGHSVGLDDLYDGSCSEQTMYGYATEGETKKRTLEAGDIAGVQELYK